VGNPCVPNAAVRRLLHVDSDVHRETTSAQRAFAEWQGRPLRNGKDVQILRELARRYAEAAAADIQDQRRDLWRRHNSLERTRPLLYMRGGSCWSEILDPQLRCAERFYRAHERALRQRLFVGEVADDSVLEPWITQRASYVLPPHGHWGPEVKRIRTQDKHGTFIVDAPIKDLGDLSGLAEVHHVIDEDATARNVCRLHDAVGDILAVNVDRRPFYSCWAADISTDIAYLRGLEQIMWDMSDDPGGLHRLLGFMRDGVLRVHAEAEAAGDWTLCCHDNQAMPYAQELADPKANSAPVRRDQLWVFCASQELTLVSPAMHWEFMLQYQVSIMARFGLSAYGCCEDLTHKIDILRRVPNLRRIAVTPRADVRNSAEQIGEDYVLSWRPNPAEMVCCGWNEDHVRRIIRDGLEAARGCHVDITLKDVETVQGDPRRLKNWVRLVRELSDNY